MLNFYKIDDIAVEGWQTAVILEDKRQYHTVKWELNILVKKSRKGV